MIHPDVKRTVEARVGEISMIRSVGGGCISNASRIDAAGHSFFLKWSTGEAGNTFEAESEGLQTLRSAGSNLLIPEVLAVQNMGPQAVAGSILMRWVDEGPKGSAFWHRLGVALASLHHQTGQSFGFGSDNYIGRIVQVNGYQDNWVDFFRDRRLDYQRGVARNFGRWRTDWDAHFDRLMRLLPDILPDSPVASLVHGDLWAGNVLATVDAVPVLIDPAAHYAHREVDLAMSELFGGFDRLFYQAYNEAWPLEPEYATRRDVYNLYHLINHLNHFGQGYSSQVGAILQAY
ncbi:fructosamine kinase family protein [Bacteroidota bacterium]